jgi:Mg2+-importing ATPase
LPLTPLQIILSDFLTDFPCFTIASDNVLEKEVKKPTHYKAKELFLLLVCLGIVAGLFNITAYIIFSKGSPQFARTVIFFQTTLSGIFVFYSIRTDEWFFMSKPSFLMHFSIILALILTFLSVFPPFNFMFEFENLSLKIIIFFLLFNFIFLLITDLIKKIVVGRKR